MQALRPAHGDGTIDFPPFLAAVDAAGYCGDVEVEIFNADVWASPGAEVVDTVVRRYLDVVAVEQARR